MGARRRERAKGRVSFARTCAEGVALRPLELLHRREREGQLRHFVLEGLGEARVDTREL